MKTDKHRAHIAALQNQIELLEYEVKEAQLLRDIWHELGPYSDALSNELRYRLQDHFEFDDSE
jgi:hypothetical protein